MANCALFRPARGRGKRGPCGARRVPAGVDTKVIGDPWCRGYSDGAPRGAGASGEHVVLPVTLLKLNLPALTCSAGLHFTLPQSAAH